MSEGKGSGKRPKPSDLVRAELIALICGDLAPGEDEAARLARMLALSKQLQDPD